MVVAHYRSTKNTSASRICRFKSSRTLFGSGGFDSHGNYSMANIYTKWRVSMIKTLWNIYIKQKTRNLTRIPIFAMIGGMNYEKFLAMWNADT